MYKELVECKDQLESMKEEVETQYEKKLNAKNKINMLKQTLEGKPCLICKAYKKAKELKKRKKNPKRIRNFSIQVFGKQG